MRKDQGERRDAAALNEGQQYLLKTSIGDVLAELTDKKSLTFKIVRGTLQSNKSKDKRWGRDDELTAPFGTKFYEPTVMNLLRTFRSYSPQLQSGRRGKAKTRKQSSGFVRDRQINPDTGRAFLDSRSRITKDGRVICRGADMTELRERVGKREGEICQRPDCLAWAQIYPPEGFYPGEMHHKRGRGGGKRNDILSEQDWLCHGCHEKTHRPKACPKKPAVFERVKA